MSPDAEVFRVLPGSLIVLRDVDLGPELDATGLLVEEMVRACGHDQFTVLSIHGDARAEVIGPEELRARLRAALDDSEATLP